jgi:2-hydroxychromene-2-carboxylate isomerase
MSAPTPPRLYFSLRSPYSWLAVERLRHDVPDLFQRFELLPYWDPDPTMASELERRGGQLPYSPMSKPKHRYVLLDTKRLAARLGLPMAWPIDIDCWWEVPHLAWLVARRLGAAESFYDALIRARWTRGEDICQPDVLAVAAVEVGLDTRPLTAAASDPLVRSDAAACLIRAYEDDIFGVPYLLVGRQRFWGYDRVPLALELLGNGSVDRPITEQPPPELLDPSRCYDTDTAGGCG